MSIFQRIYPNRERIQLDGGLNNKFERSIILDNESPDCQNVIFKNGAVETRQGAQKLNTTSVGSFVGDGLYTRHANDGTETMIVWAGGTAYALTGTSTFTTIGSGQSVMTAGQRVGAAQQENHIFFGNGGVDPYKWNGTNFTRHGIPAPTSAPTASTNGAGVLSGVYQWKYTWVNSQLVESDVSPPSNTLNVAASTVHVTSIATAPASFGVIARRLYRTVSSGVTFLRVTTINDNTTLFYDDNIPDSALGVTAPDDVGTPPKYNAIIYHKNRLFMNDPSRPNYVWYTELDNPFSVPSTNFLIIGDNAFDLVKGFAVQDNALVVFCENYTWLVYMADPSPANWTVVKAKSAFGSRSPYAAVNFENMTLFPAVQNEKFVGFVQLRGDQALPDSNQLTIFGIGSETSTYRLEPDMFNVQESFLKNISGILFKNRVYYALTYDSSNTTNNRIYVMDFSMEDLGRPQKQAWVPWTGLSPAQFTIYTGKLYYVASIANGFVYQLESGAYNDDGTAINSYFWTKEFSGYEKEYNLNKDFRNANILLENVGDWYMKLTYRVDSDIGVGDTTDVYLNPGGSLWGSAVFGRDLWGGGSVQRDYRQFLGTSRGKRIQFKFATNTANQRFKVHGLNFTYNLKSQKVR